MRFAKGVLTLFLSSTVVTNVSCFTANFSPSSFSRIQSRVIPKAATIVNGDASTTSLNNEEEKNNNIEDSIKLSISEKARTVISVCRSGTLCTISQSEGINGAPFGSYVDYVLDDEGNPVFLMNEQSMHTVNIESSNNDEDSSKVTLFTQLKSTSGLDARGQDVSRCSLTGIIEKIDENNFPDRDAIRLRYSLTHAYADRVMDSPRFSFYRLRPTKLFFVGGFGVTASWVPVPDYYSASPDILARESGEIISKLNQGEAHSEDLVNVAVHLCGLQNVQQITVTNVDRLGIDIRVTRQATRSKLLTEEFRLGFRIPVLSVEDAKSEIVKIFQEAWELGQGFDWNEGEDNVIGVPILKTAVQSLD